MAPRRVGPAIGFFINFGKCNCPGERAMDHGNWQIGQRVSRKDSNELGFVVEVESIT
jgi:hypothetical protein